MVLKRNQQWLCCALFGLFAGLSLTAEAQTVGVPETPQNPQLPSNVPASVAPAPPVVGGVPEGDFFTLGDPLKPLGQSLASKGIYLKGFWGSTLYANVSGGTQRTKVVYNEAFYGADFDLERIAGLAGTVIHFSLDSRFGGIPQGVNNL